VAQADHEPVDPARQTRTAGTAAVGDERPAAFFGAATVGVCNQSLWSGDGNKKHKWMRHRALPARTPQLDAHMPSLTKSCYCFSNLRRGTGKPRTEASVAEFEAAGVASRAADTSMTGAVPWFEVYLERQEPIE